MPSDQEIGIFIKSEGILKKGDGNIWPLRGFFQIDQTSLDTLTGNPLRSVAVALTPKSIGYTQATYIIHDEILFEEDFTKGELIRAYFNVDLLGLFEFFSAYDTYFIVASIGKYTSNILTIDVSIPGFQEESSTTPMEEEDEEEEVEDDVDIDEEEEDDDEWMVEEEF